MNGLYIYVYITRQTQGPIFLFPFYPLELFFGTVCAVQIPPPPPLFLNVDANCTFVSGKHLTEVPRKPSLIQNQGLDIIEGAFVMFMYTCTCIFTCMIV